MKTVVPLSAVIATRNRAASFGRTLDSLCSQEPMPVEFIVVDASDDDETKNVLKGFIERIGSPTAVRWFAAKVAGAAPQRNEGVIYASQSFIWFMDDDILLEPNCVERLWNAINSDPGLGGVNATIVNQGYHAPGLISRTMFALMHGKAEKSFAGRVIGPAVNLLPEDRDHLSEVVPVEWLNLGSTMYRREALPDPPFDSHFTGYSLMEDVALSLRVAKSGWKLANARTARIFHDSQPGEHKSAVAHRAAMELVNRHYVMTKVMGKRSFADYVRLVTWELFALASNLRSKESRCNISSVLAGKFAGIREIRSMGSAG